MIQAASSFWDVLPAIITALGTIIMGWFGYNQYTKNKMTDRKLEQWKEEEDKKSEKRAEDLAKIYGELWHLLHVVNADRVYIVQPHPLTNNLYLSISLEVREKGISAMKPHVHRLQMAEVPGFSSELATRDFMYYKNIAEDIKDDKARSLFLTNGTDMVVIKRMGDDTYGWIGSIFIEFARPTDISPVLFRSQLALAADNIRYILPEYK